MTNQLLAELEALQQENKQLKEELERSMKANIVLDNTNTDYASIIFELEEYIKAVYNMPEIDTFEKVPLDMIIEKLQKLKEKYK